MEATRGALQPGEEQLLPTTVDIVGGPKDWVKYKEAAKERLAAVVRPGKTLAAALEAVIRPSSRFRNAMT